MQLLHIFFVGYFFDAISTMIKFVGDTKPDGPRMLLWPGQNAVTFRDWSGRGHREQREISCLINIKFCKARVKKDWQWEDLAAFVTLRETNFPDCCLGSVLACLFMKQTFQTSQS